MKKKMRRIALTLSRARGKIRWVKLYMLLTVVVMVCWFTFSLAQPSIEVQNKQVIWQGEIITPSDERFVVQKILGRDGIESTVFIDEQGRMHTKAEFNARLASQEPKIDSKLSEMLTSGDQDEIVPLIVVLKEQPQVQKSDEVKKKYLPLIREYEEQIKGIYKRHRDEYFKEEGYGEYIELENPASLFNYLTQHVTDGEKKTISNAVITMERLLGEMRREFYVKAVSVISSEQANLVEYIESLGGQIKAQYVTFNALSVNIALKHVRQIAERPEVARVLKDQLLSMSLNKSADAIDADAWWDAGYDGGPWDVGIVDSGVDETHPALSGHRFNVISFADSDQDGTVDEDEDDYQGHGTHVAGIVASTDSKFKGVAYGLEFVNNAKAAYRNTTDGRAHMWWSDAMEAIDWVADTLTGETHDSDVINLSYGGNPGSGDTYFARFMDAVVDDLYCPVVVSAGNKGADGVTNPGVAYNILSVAASDDHNSVSRGDDSLCAFSSRGLTGDDRMKPDITAPGDAIRSCNYDWEGPVIMGLETGLNPDFVSKSGTSMAAPHIAGAHLLLLNYGITNPMVMKALLINTAEKMGFTGWDPGWGWGYVDLDQAYYHRTDTFTATIDDVAGDDYVFYKGLMSSGDLVTLVWNRHVDYNGSNPPTTYYPCSDIDLSLWCEATDGLIDRSASLIDNVEQVTVDTARWVIVKVNSFGSFDPGIATEDIALATEENFQSVSPPSFTVSMSNPSSIGIGQFFYVSATVTNTGDIVAHDVEVTLNLPPGLTLFSGSNPQNIGTIYPGLSKTASWQVEATSADDYTMTTSVESYSYEELFTGDGSSTIIVKALPVADADGPYYATEGVPVTFDGSGSYDPDGKIVSYEWDFGDGNIGSGVNPTHTYTQEGTYTVTLAVIDDDALTDTDRTTATIRDTEPIADFSTTPTSGPEPLTVDFNDLSTSYDGITSWEWDFNNDGIVDSTLQNPTHVYALEGTYAVRLKVYEGDGDSDIKINYIAVSDAEPVADFCGAPRTGPFLIVRFTDLSTSYDGIVLWFWDFGDGGTSTEQNPTHIYANKGTYTVSLTVFERDGDSARETKVNYIIVELINVGFEEAHLPLFTIGSNPAYEITGGYAGFAEYLTANGYFVSTIDPGTTIDPSALDPIDVLVIVAPQNDFTTPEIDAIETWVRDGGTLLLITDFNGYGVEASNIAARFDITQPFDMILDSDENVSTPYWPYYDGANLLAHPVTAGVARVEMYTSDGITSAPADAIPLIMTDSDETATWASGPPALGISLMSAIDRGGTAGSGRLIVITDTNLWDSAYDFDGDRDVNFYDSDNEILALNAINWLSAVIHDVAVTDVTLSKTIVGEGYSMSIDVTVENQGACTETFNVTTYANITIIGTFTNITLTSGNSTTVTFTWDTTGVAKGNYTITAYASPVQNETDLTNNMFIDGIVAVTISGDVDGDFDVDIYDIVKICAAYDSKKGDPKYVPNCDINCDGEIDIYDVVIACAHYEEHYP